MNEIVKKFLLAGEKFMSEMHIRQPAALGKPGFTYSTCIPFTIKKERIQKIQRNRRCKIYQNKLIKVCFQLDMTYGDFKEWLLMKYYVIKHLILLKIQNMMNTKEVLR